MQAIAKVFSTGHSQAVRLPKAFRVDVSEMWISKNEVTSEITLKPKATDASLDAFFALLKAQPSSDEFLQPRHDAPALNPLADWAV